jgi:5-methylcytosine-specific restriction protein A
MRAALFRRNPLCVECQRAGRVRLATQRDHIQSLGEEGTDTEDNVQGLCDDCHEAKSLAEALRARRHEGRGG